MNLKRLRKLLTLEQQRLGQFWLMHIPYIDTSPLLLSKSSYFFRVHLSYIYVLLFCQIIRTILFSKQIWLSRGSEGPLSPPFRTVRLSNKIFDSHDNNESASAGRGLVYYACIRFNSVWRFGVAIHKGTDEAAFTCVSVSINEVATSNLFGLLRYLFCLNCFSNSSSCCDVKAVLGLLVFPRRACWAAQPVDDKYIWVYLIYLAP